MVYHVGGGTLNYQSPFKTYLNFRNNLVTMIKNLPPNQVFSTVFFRMILDGIAGVKYLLSGDFIIAGLQNLVMSHQKNALSYNN